MDSQEQSLLEHVQRPSPYNASIFAFLTIFSISLSIVNVQQWMILYFCKSSISNPNWETCRVDTQVQRTTAQWNMWIGLCQSIPALLSGPFWGTLSDQIGRKPIFLISPLAGIIAFGSYILTDYFNLGLWLIITAQFIQGCLGGWQVGLVTMLSYFTDLSEPEERSNIFVIGEAIPFLGFCFGPFIGGILANHLPGGIVQVFLITVAGLILTMIYVVLFLPESLQKDSLTSSRRTLGESFIAMKELLMEKNVMVIALTCACLTAALHGKSQFFYFAAMKLGWDTYSEGQYILFGTIVRLIYMILVFPIIKSFFKTLNSNPNGRAKFNLNLIRSALCTSTLTAILLGFINSTEQVYYISFFDGFSTLATPTLRTLLSNSAQENAAQLFSSVQFFEQSIGIIAGMVYPIIWANSLATLPNLFLIVTGIVYLLAFILMLSVKEADVCEKEQEIPE